MYSTISKIVLQYARLSGSTWRRRFFHLRKWCVMGPRRIVSLTTIPGRITNIQLTIDSLISQNLQPDEVILWVPTNHRRVDQTKIEKIPSYLENSGITVNRCEDVGPFTSLAPNLKREEPDTVIVTADDDVYYPPTWFEGLVSAAEQYPNHAIGYRGRRFKNYEDMAYQSTRVYLGADPPEEVDLITSTWGALYRPRFFDSKIFDQHEFPRSFFNDDIWICGHLARRRIPRLILPDPGIEPILEIAYLDALWEIDKNANHNDAIIRFLAKHYREGRP